MRATGELAVSEALREAESALHAAGVPTARLDAEVLLAKAMGLDRGGVYARLAEALPAAARDRYRAMIDRRRRREPVAYITGAREFWSLPIAVTRDVLVPRPETELLVEVAAGLLAHHPAPLLCDVGTGSGCLAVAVARQLPRARVLGTDLSLAALALARRNASAHGVADRVFFSATDLFAGLAARDRFDAVLSNPPYLAAQQPREAELAWEPPSALAAGRDGLDVIRRLLGGVVRFLRPGGAVLMEFGLGQDRAVRRLAAEAGLTAVDVWEDLAGVPRVLVARKKN
jgi:release factor glutamine methyltransferase